MSKKHKRDERRQSLDPCLHCELVKTINRHGEEHGHPVAGQDYKANHDDRIIDALVECVAQLSVEGGAIVPNGLQDCLVYAQTRLVHHLQRRFFKLTGRHLPLVGVNAGMLTDTVAEQPQEEPAPGERKH